MKGKVKKKAVSTKTGKLIREGKDPKQAYAIAQSMADAGRLGERGGYKRVKRKAKRK